MSASHKTSLIPLLVALLTLLALTDAVPYSKYGRSCRDIGCRSDEVCVMAEDPCGSYTQRDSCGRYPTCQKSSSGGESCTTKLCPSGTYCKTENGRPTCVNTTPGLAPAARRPPGYVRPQVTQRPVVTPPTAPPRRPPTPPPQRPPTPPPRGNSPFGDRTGYSGGRNTIGGGSLWQRLFGDSYPSKPSGPATNKPTSRPTSNYYPGGKDNYKTHESTDSKGNKVWTFSG